MLIVFLNPLNKYLYCPFYKSSIPQALGKAGSSLGKRIGPRNAGTGMPECIGKGRSTIPLT